MRQVLLKLILQMKKQSQKASANIPREVEEAGHSDTKSSAPNHCSTLFLDLKVPSFPFHVLQLDHSLLAKRWEIKVRMEHL